MTDPYAKNNVGVPISIKFVTKREIDVSLRLLKTIENKKYKDDKRLNDTDSNNNTDYSNYNLDKG